MEERMADEVAQTLPPRPWVVLLVDDEEDVLDSVARFIEHSFPRVQVLRAAGGRQALEVLEKERVDLIVSDFKMPGMDGIEFLYQARKVRPHVPRVMMTAFGSEELARRAVTEAVVSSFLSKASSPRDLIRDLARLLRYEPGHATAV